MLSSYLEKGTRSIKDIVMDNISRLLNNNNCVLFGAGAGGASVYAFICENIESGDEKVKCFVDNNPLKWGTCFMGKQVVSADVFF